MARVYLTDDQVELEIERLSASPLVALARKEERIRLRRRTYMYKLRDLEKKGAALAQSGITMDVLDAMDADEITNVYSSFDKLTATNQRIVLDAIEKLADKQKQTSKLTPAQKEAISKALDDPQKRAGVCKILGIKEG